MQLDLIQDDDLDGKEQHKADDILYDYTIHYRWFARVALAH